MSALSRLGMAGGIALAVAAAVCAGAAEAPRDLRDLAYVENGHARQRLDLFLPAGGAAKVPLILFVHGGGWRSGSKAQCLPASLGFRERGYAVASIGYRLSQDAVFPAQIEDCKAAVRWLRAHAGDYGLDPDRFVAWGTSAGGHLVALLGTAGDVAEFDVGPHAGVSSRVQAVIDYFGPTDFERFLATPGYESHRRANAPEVRLLGGPLHEKRALAAKASPVSFATRDDPPFLLLHGAKDRTVPWNQSEALHAALTKAGVASELRILPQAGHGGREFTDATALGWVNAFLARTVGR